MSRTETRALMMSLRQLPGAASLGNRKRRRSTTSGSHARRAPTPSGSSNPRRESPASTSTKQTLPPPKSTSLASTSMRISPTPDPEEASTSPTPQAEDHGRHALDEHPAGSSSTANQSLACPFYKHNPSQHRSCAQAYLAKISYLKQHLFRKHDLPYCPRCFQTFQDNIRVAEHLRQVPSCDIVDQPSDFPGMTNEQSERIRARANPRHTEQEQWKEIWKILFPGIPPPASVYIELDLPEEVNDLREHMAQYIPPRIIEELGLDETEELLRKATQLVLVISSQWIEKRRIDNREVRTGQGRGGVTST
jgi:hypothetical protein